MSHETHLDEHFTAGKTARVTLELRDDLTGAAIPGALIDALTLTLFNRRSGAFLPAAPATGARQNQDILGVNGGSISAAGVGTMGLGAADMAHVDPTCPACGAVLQKRDPRETVTCRCGWRWAEGGDDAERGGDPRGEPGLGRGPGGGRRQGRR